jgi:hypothetical protein
MADELNLIVNPTELQRRIINTIHVVRRRLGLTRRTPPPGLAVATVLG